MGLNVYSMTVESTGTEEQQLREIGMELVNFLNSFIDAPGKIVKNILTKNDISPIYATAVTQEIIPSWCVTGGTMLSSSLIIGSVSFVYNGVNMVFAVYYNYTSGGSAGNGKVHLKLFVKTPQYTKYYDIALFSTSYSVSGTVYYENGDVLSLVWGLKDNLYLVFEKQFNATSTGSGTTPLYFGVFKIDKPTNPADTNAYVFLNGGDATLNNYITPYLTEDVNNTEVKIVSETGLIEHDTSFTRNFYNNKIPMSRIYAFTPIQGIRGEISSLMLAPANYILENQFYNINGANWMGVENFGGKFSNNGKKNILLKE